MPAPWAERFDYVFAGAGDKALVCAACLAQGGSRVLLLEGRTLIGGGVKSAEVLLPGFMQDRCSWVHSGINQKPELRDTS